MKGWTTAQILALALGVLILFVVWEYAPRMWGGLLLIAIVLILAAKALKAAPAAAVPSATSPGA